MVTWFTGPVVCEAEIAMLATMKCFLQSADVAVSHSIRRTHTLLWSACALGFRDVSRDEDIDVELAFQVFSTPSVEVVGVVQVTDLSLGIATFGAAVTPILHCARHTHSERGAQLWLAHPTPIPFVQQPQPPPVVKGGETVWNLSEEQHYCSRQQWIHCGSRMQGTPVSIYPGSESLSTYAQSFRKMSDRNKIFCI